MKKIFFTILALAIFANVHSQSELWKHTEARIPNLRGELQNVNPDNAYTLDFNTLKNTLRQAPKRNFSQTTINSSAIISIPTEDDSFEQYRVVEASNFSKELAAKFPNITAYVGQSLKDPTKRISISMASRYLKINIFGVGKMQIIEPAVKGENTYISYNTQQVVPSDFKCMTKDQNIDFGPDYTTNDFDDSKFRTYRLAVVGESSFTNYFGSVADALAGINDLVSIINPIYENDFAIHLELVADNDEVIFENPSDDGYSWSSQFQNNYNDHTQAILDDIIGNSNYDVGIVFSMQAAGGQAGGIGVVCNTNNKGSSYAGADETGLGLTPPEGFSYAMTIAHELGHTFGANHGFSSYEGTGVEIEPGSGSSIMGYSGATIQYDVQSVSDPMFNNESIRQVSQYVKNQSCGTEDNISNNPPTVDAGTDYNIPHGTAFKLTADGSDPDGDDITYSWEEDDPTTTQGGGFGQNFSFPSPTSTTSEDPSFRVYMPVESPTRYFPPFEDVLRGNLYPTWNMTNDDGRDFHFAVVVRDNNINGGQTATDKMQVSVSEDAGPFKITSIAVNDNLDQGSTHTLTWDVAGTDSGNINVSDVKISISTDGGETFSTLIASTPNDGEEDIQLPNQEEDDVYIMIEAIDNVFYAVSPHFGIGIDVGENCDTYYGNADVDLPNNYVFTQADIIQVPVNVNESGNIKNAKLHINLSDASLPDLFIGIIEPWNTTGEIHYIYAGSCDTNARNMNVTFDDYGESAMIHCDDMTGHFQAPLINFEDEYQGQNKQGMWIVVFAYQQVSSGGGANLGGHINAVNLQFCEDASGDDLGMEDQSLISNDFKVYPNPATEQINFEVSPEISGASGLEIYDMNGRQVMNKEYKDGQELNNRSISISDLSAGIYFVRFHNGSQHIVKKLIVK